MRIVHNLLHIALIVVIVALVGVYVVIAVGEVGRLAHEEWAEYRCNFDRATQPHGTVIARHGALD